MRQKKINILWTSMSACLLLCSSLAGSTGLKPGEPETQKRKAIEMLANIVKDNENFVSYHDASYFKNFIHSQSPRATCVTCADSRVHFSAFDRTPDNDIFKVVNLSGQYASGRGSIKYGVLKQKTPVLMIIGHDDCGAVEGRMMFEGPDEVKDADLNGELQTVFVLHDGLTAKEVKSSKDLVQRNIRYNIHRQVDECLKAHQTNRPASEIKESEAASVASGHEGVSFRDLVKKGQLIIVGALYDFANIEGAGYGKLHIINVWDQERLNEWDKNDENAKSLFKEEGAGNRTLLRGAEEPHNSDILDDDIHTGPVYLDSVSIDAAIDRITTQISKLMPKPL